MNLRDAAQMAIDLLLRERNALYECHSVGGGGVPVDDPACAGLMEFDDAITTLKQALAEHDRLEGIEAIEKDAGIHVSQQTAQQAIEALEDACGGRCNAEYNPCFQREVATALRAALAEPECKCTMRQKMVGDGCAVCNPERAKDLAEPEQEMTKQKPVAWTDGRGFIASHADSFPRGTTVSPLYAHPPTPRKPLTDGEIERVCAPLGAAMLSFTEVARAIERAHGIGEQT